MEDEPRDDRRTIRGLELRSLLVLLLVERCRSMAVTELAASVERQGFGLAGRPSKAVADALQWEIGRGRVVRVARRHYVAGHVAKVTRHRMRARVAATRNPSVMRPPSLASSG